MNNRSRLRLLLSALTLVLIWPSSVYSAFEDDEACLMCHKYPRMGRITQEGVFRSYHVPPTMFSKTVHRNVPCRDCHSYIKELPHLPVEEGVRCDQQCHSKNNPATGRPFSHKPIHDLYAKSVHAREKQETGPDADKPYCITCHTNPVYNPHEEVPPKKIVDRCELCHEKADFVEQWYFHTSRRVLEVKRSGQEIVEMCTRCHANKELIERQMEAAKEEGKELGKKFPIAGVSYEESFHGKVSRYGLHGTATCLDCHADDSHYYKGVHEILPSRDPKSPVSDQARVATCQKCHENADAKYVDVDPHPTFDEEFNPILHHAESIYGIVGEVVVLALVGLSMFETFGRRRDGAGWRIRSGSTWWRRTRRRRDRILPR